jgi:cellulose synthase/poly-beta-1,6-N-acetylglucosamine synthase-like glycosyltransferase
MLSDTSTMTTARFALIGMLVSTLWTYVGYPVLLLAVNRRAGKRIRSSVSSPEDAAPTMTVVVAALDEEAVIEEKIVDLRKQRYPADKLQLVVVADGSTDRTAQIARSLGVECLWQRERRGKTSAINRAMEVAEGEVTCLTDANCALAPGALVAIAAHFSDREVGIVSGAKTVSGHGGRATGESLYWRFEDMVKTAESNLGVTMGAPGELLGIRTSLFRPMPEDVINDDFFLTCDVLDQGHAARYEGEALTSETTPATVREEFDRRTRIAAGTWQSCIAFARLGSPQRGWLAVSFISHRVLRNLVVPVMLPLIWALSRSMRHSLPLGRLLSRAQQIAYGAAAVGLVTDATALAPFSEFLLLNAAQLRGGFRWITGRQSSAWDKPVRGTWA